MVRWFGPRVYGRSSRQRNWSRFVYSLVISIVLGVASGDLGMQRFAPGDVAEQDCSSRSTDPEGYDVSAAIAIFGARVSAKVAFRV